MLLLKLDQFSSQTELVYQIAPCTAFVSLQFRLCNISGVPEIRGLIMKGNLVDLLHIELACFLHQNVQKVLQKMQFTAASA